MNQKEFLVVHGKLLDTIRDITARKNADYSKSENAFANFEMVEKLGITDTTSGILVRVCDKFARIINLSKQDAQVKEESIMDTLLDMANYCVILGSYVQSKKNAKENNEADYVRSLNKL